VNRIQLGNGTWLDRRPDGLFLWQPEERVVRVTVTDGEATITTDGPRPEVLEVVRVVAAAPARGSRKPKDGKPTTDGTSGKPKADAYRWAMLNAFCDAVAQHLTPAEQAVWHYLFRHCRDGKASVSTRGVSAAVNVTPKTVTAALRWLKDRRLVWEIAKSSHKGTASLYGLHQNPERIAEACRTANLPRISKRHRQTPRRRKPR
jgi:hypothetical protein